MPAVSFRALKFMQEQNTRTPHKAPNHLTWAQRTEKIAPNLSPIKTYDGNQLSYSWQLLREQLQPPKPPALKLRLWGDAAGAVLPVSESTAEATEPTAPATPVLDDLGGLTARGDAKSRWRGSGFALATARLKLNGRNSEHYFPRMAQRIHAVSPLKQVGLGERLDVYATVKGGGVSGQAGALRHGLRGLCATTTQG